MGLILCGAFLIAFYLIKIICPEFIIGIAETPRLVEIGVALQSNKWYLHLFNFVVGYIHGYLLCCACCRTYKLNWKGNLVFLCACIFLRIVSEFYPEHYTIFSFLNLILTPFIICYLNKNVNQRTFVSTILCNAFDIFCQVFSLVVRNLALISTKGNVVTYLILIIDMVIWRIMLYLFFNYKNKESNENGI